MSTPEQRKQYRRKVLKGYPVTDKFMSLEDVNRYLEGDRIVCLQCGKMYKSVGQHVAKTHGMTCDEYRELYGIPYTYGLVSSDTAERYAVKASERAERRGSELIENLERGRATIQKKIADEDYAHRIAYADSQRRKEHARNLPHVNNEIYTNELADKFCKVMAEVGSVGEVIRMRIYGFPKSTSVTNDWLNRHEYFRTLYYKTVDEMPHHLRAKREQLGDRFRKHAMRLVNAGCSQKDVAGILGVGQMAVSRHIRNVKK